MFDDPYAAAFVAAADPEPTGDTSPSPQRQALAFQIVVRTRYYDDYLRNAVDDGCRQVVLLAAGLDTRAFRLSWPPGTRVFEVDLPDLVEVKERVLADAGAQPQCERAVVAADLREDWLSTLTGAGFDAGMPTAWLVEGLLVYLDTDDARALLRTVTTASARGSRLSFEHTANRRGFTAPDIAAVTALWRGGAGDDVEAWLAELGWSVTIDNLGDVASRYGRPASRPVASGFLRAAR